MDESLIMRRDELKKRLLTLEWDNSHKQLHYAREMELKAHRLELETIEKEIRGNVQ
jgi:hypothetical protein